MITFLREIARAFTWFVVVAPWEQALRVRFGKHVRLLNAGFYFRIPFVDRVFKQSVRRRLMNIRAQTLTTRDGRVVTCACAIGFSISDLRKLYDTLENAADTIENQAAALVATFIGERDYAQCAAPAMAEFVRERLHLDRYGMAGDEFYVTSFATARTYRFISGDLASWNHGGVLQMEVTPQSS